MKRSELSVLVVEDDRTLRQLLVEILTSNGYHAIGAENGAEALAILSERPIALIVLDLLLPDMDGETFLQHARSRSDRHVPVVLLSAVGDVAQQAEALEADGYLEKPFDYDALLTLVGQLLTRHQ